MAPTKDFYNGIVGLFVVDSKSELGLLAQNVPEIMQRFRDLRNHYLESNAKEQMDSRKKMLHFLCSKVLDARIKSMAIRREIGLCLAALLEDAQHSMLTMATDKIKTVLSTTRRDEDNRLLCLECLGCLISHLKRQFAALFFGMVVQVVSKQVRDSNDTVRELSLQALYLLVLECGTQSQTNDVSKVLYRSCSDRSPRVRYVAGLTIGAVVDSLTNIKQLNLFAQPCQKALADPNTEVRAVFAAALGTLFASAARVHSTSQQPNAESDSGIDRGLSCLQSFFAKESSPIARSMFSQSVVVLLRKSEASLSESNLEKVTKKLLSFIQHSPSKGTVAAIRTDDDANQSAECVLMMICNGLTPCTNERGLETVAATLVAEIHRQVQILEKKGGARGVSGIYNEQVLILCLKAVSFIMIKLGPTVEECSFKKQLIDCIFFLCTAPRQHVRVYSAHCLRHLVRSAPKQAGTWIRFFKDFLTGSVSTIEPSHPLSSSSYQAIHGQILALTAVASVLPETKSGIPMSLLAGVYDCAYSLLSRYSLLSFKSMRSRPDASLWASLLEKAWNLMGSLFAAETEWLAARASQLSRLWEKWLVSESGGVLRELRARPPKTQSRAHMIEEPIACRILRCVSASLRAMRGLYLRHDKFRGRVGGRALVSAVLALRSIQERKHNKVIPSEPKSSHSNSQAQFAQLNRKLEQAFGYGFDNLSLLPPEMFHSHFRPLLYMTVAQFTNRSAGVACCVDRRLNPQDSVLSVEKSPLIVSFDLLTRRSPWKLADNSSMWITNGPACSGHSALEWHLPRSHSQAEWGIPVKACTSMAGLEELSSCSCGIGLGVDLGSYITAGAKNIERAKGEGASAAVRLFGRIFPNQSEVNQAQLLDHFHALIRKTYELYKTRRPAADSQPAVLINIASALLALSLEFNSRSKDKKSKETAEDDTVILASNNGNKSAAISSTTKKKLLQVCFGLNKHPNAFLRRLVGETLGILCATGGAGLATAVRNSLQGCLELKNRSGVSGGALALACVHRYSEDARVRGGAELSKTVTALTIKGQEMPDKHRSWILHSIATALQAAPPASVGALVLPLVPLLYSNLMQHKHSSLMLPILAFETAGELVFGMLSGLGAFVWTAKEQKPILSKLMLVFDLLFDHIAFVLERERGMTALSVRSDRTAGIWVIMLRIIRLIVSSGPHAMKWVDIEKVWSFVYQACTEGPTEESRLTAIRCLEIWVALDKKRASEKDIENALIGMYDQEASLCVKESIKEILINLIDSTPEPKSYAVTTPQASRRRRRKKAEILKYEAPPIWQIIDTLKRVVIGSRRLPSDARREAKKAAYDRQKGKQKEAKDETDMGDGMVSARGNDGKDEKSRKEWKVDTKAMALSSLTHCLRLADKQKLLIVENVEKGHVIAVLDQIADLVTVGCMAAAQAAVGVKLKGLRVLEFVVEKFGRIVDPNPDMEGSLLLAQYVGQLTSTMRGGLKTFRGESEEPYHSPYAFAAGLDFASKLIPSVLRTDKVVIKRIFSTINEAIDFKNSKSLFSMWQVMFDGASVLDASLNALSTILNVIQEECLANKTRKKSERDALSEFAEAEWERLRAYCILGAKDAAVVRTQRFKVVQSLRGTFFVGRDVSHAQKVFTNHVDTLIKLAFEADKGKEEDLLLESKLLAAESKFSPSNLLGLLISSCIFRLSLLTPDKILNLLESLNTLLAQNHLKKAWISLDLLIEVIDALGYLLTKDDIKSDVLSKAAEIIYSVTSALNIVIKEEKGNEDEQKRSVDLIQRLSLSIAHLLRRQNTNGSNFRRYALLAAKALCCIDYAGWKGAELDWSVQEEKDEKDNALNMASFFVDADEPEAKGKPNPFSLSDTLTPALTELLLPLITSSHDTKTDTTSKQALDAFSEICGAAVAHCFKSDKFFVKKPTVAAIAGSCGLLAEELNKKIDSSSISESRNILGALAVAVLAGDLLRVDCGKEAKIVVENIGKGEDIAKVVVESLAKFIESKNAAGASEKGKSMGVVLQTLLPNILYVLPTCDDSELLKSAFVVLLETVKSLDDTKQREIAIELFCPLIIAHLTTPNAKEYCLATLAQFKELHISFEIFVQTLPNGLQDALGRANSQKRKEEKSKEGASGKKKTKSEKKKKGRKKGKKKKQKEEQLNIDFTQY